ncbi:MAG: NUDIX domain-containing protein [Patescibacteria group bacterium]
MTGATLLIVARGSDALVACQYDRRIALAKFTATAQRDTRLLSAISRVAPATRLHALRLIIVAVRMPSFSQTRAYLTTANALSAAIGCPVVQISVGDDVLEPHTLIAAGVAASRKPHPRWVVPTYSGEPNITLSTRGTKLHISAGGIVFDPHRHALLFVQRKDNLRIGTPKGHREGHETLVETAKREIAEETGVVDIEMLARLSAVHYLTDDHGALPKRIPHILHHFLFRRKGNQVVPRVMGGEVKNLRLLWLPVTPGTPPPHLHKDLKPILAQAVRILQARGMVQKPRQTSRLRR